MPQFSFIKGPAHVLAHFVQMHCSAASLNPLSFDYLAFLSHKVFNFSLIVISKLRQTIGLKIEPSREIEKNTVF
jgi:hypothetical protein